MSRLRIEKIVSGGQTGVDRGALDAAIFVGIEHGGWCPSGRLAEDGKIPPRYQLRETDSAKYPVRTERNVVNSDGTLILFESDIHGGTELTIRLATKHNKPLFKVDLSEPTDIDATLGWIDEHEVRTLNVAGPRESSANGIADAAREFLVRLLRHAGE